ncbi:hypothetical protein AYO44_04070 [Planctomycetaceae bacterium SCGC AG-212-F19]|nr:hypothetical protein AYO44_04070 [Planctomycetaceae bacterium SCGC AG-212-F19]
MNCTEAQDLLQRRLDGAGSDHPAGLAQHLAACGECRLLHAAAGRLEEGLRLMPRPMPRPMPPPALRTSIVAGVLADRRRIQRRRRVVFGMALAASVGFFMLAALTYYSPPQGDNWAASKIREIHNYFWPQPPLQPVLVAKDPIDSPRLPEEAPSLRASVAEAGTAMAALTRRTTNETVEQTRFLTEVLPAPMNVFEAVPPMPEQPIVAVWQGTGQRVATGFEPVTNSARRALSMLLRENPRPVNQ